MHAFESVAVRRERTVVHRSAHAVPEWAGNGTIAYARWDGGPLEVAKAHLSNWEFLINPGAVQALCDMYRKAGLDRLKAAGFNWIWLTWSAGFSYHQEEVQQAILRPFVRQCADAGIHCTAYLSLTNLFVDDLERNQPQLLECAQQGEGGKPIPYGASRYFDRPLRLLACLTHPAWRNHLHNRLDSAIEVGFDAAFYDNLHPQCTCPRCQARFAAYALQRTGRQMRLPMDRAAASASYEEAALHYGDKDPAGAWQLTHAYWTDLLGDTLSDLSRYAESLKSDFMVYCNWESCHHTFGPPALKALSSECGNTPGHVGPKEPITIGPRFFIDGHASNAGMLRSMLATAEGWRPIRLQDHYAWDGSMEGRDFVPHDGATWQRMIAECWLFRAAQEVFVEGNFAGDLFGEDERADQAWKSIAGYNHFQREHARLWASAGQSCVALAVWGCENHPRTDGDSQRTRLLTALAMSGLQFDVMLDDRATDARLAKYPLIWLPDAQTVSEANLQRLENYLRAGGRVLATARFAEQVDLSMARPAADQAKWIKRLAEAGGPRWTCLPQCMDGKIWTGQAEIPDAIMNLRETFPVQVSRSGSSILWTVWQCRENDRALVFVLNLDQRVVQENVNITINAPLHPGQAPSARAAWHSPDPQNAQAAITATADRLVCKIPRLSIFGFLDIGEGRMLR